MSTWHLTCELVYISYRYSTVLCFHENCLLAVIISPVWDVTTFLCFCGAIGGSTLITLAVPCFGGATKLTQHLRGCGSPVYWLHCALQPLVWKRFLRPTLFGRINLHAVGWLLSFFHAFGWRNISGLLGNPFCGLQYFTGLSCFISWRSLQLW